MEPQIETITCISVKCEELRKKVNQECSGTIPINQVQQIIEEIKEFVKLNYSTNAKLAQAREKAQRCEEELDRIKKDYSKYKRTLETLKNACHKRVGSVFTTTRFAK